MSKDEQRFIDLSWYLLEAKYTYYLAPQFGVLPDTVYDRLEEEYKALAKKLGKPTSVSDMVGFDDSRPSCRLVMSKVNKNKKMSKLK